MDLNDKINSIPDVVTSSFVMEEPNQTIEIRKGKFILQNNEATFELDGEIFFYWFPYNEVNFRGKVIYSSINPLYLLKTNQNFHLVINEVTFGQAFIHKSSFNNETLIEGRVTEAVLGDKTIPASRVIFTIPNLKELTGENVKKVYGDRVQFESNRILLDNDEYKIIIDKSFDFNSLNKALNNKGGFINLYSGEITKKFGQIRFNDVKEITPCLSTFLTFLNGRRTSPHFYQGIHENIEIWTDFSGYSVDPHKSVTTWSLKHSIIGFNELWIKFSNLWKDENDRDFLRSAIHWYIEANNNSGYVEGSIVLSQIALELIFNYLVIEKKQIIKGKDSKSISASNKIRLLLSQVNGSSSVPNAFKNLQMYVNGIKGNEMSDGVDAIVHIRNSIIHSQANMRKELANINNRVKYEALQLSIFYIEISLLSILGFKGKFYNRCSGKKWAGEGEISL